MKHFTTSIFIALSLCSANAFATPNDDLTARERLTTTRGLGLANSIVSEATGTSAVWHNPAAIADAAMYAVETAYRFNSDSNSHGVNANLLDMKSNEYVGAEIGYVYEYSKINDKSQHFNHIRLGLAVPFAERIVSLGVTGAYSHIKYDGKKQLSQFTMDVGLLVRPVKYIALAFTAQNLIVGDYKDVMPRMISAGIGFNSLDLGLNISFETSFNISSDDIANSGSYGGGIEYVIKNMFPIRLGYRYETEPDLHVLAAGLAFRDSKGTIGVDASYQHHFATKDNDIFQASLSLYF